jgi:hypothetical protein
VTARSRSFLGKFSIAYDANTELRLGLESASSGVRLGDIAQ